MRLRSLLASVCFLAVAQVSFGQEAAACHDFRFRTGTDPYLTLSNPAVISVFDGHISMAEISFRKDNGGLMAIKDSPDSYKAGALTESFIRISDRISFHGKLSWSYFGGKDMGAQILMDPEYNPVNFLESSEATVGRKNREDYSLLGAMAYRFNDRWSAGAGIEYVSADQTKVRDPRFTSVWMDMGLKAGVGFRPSERSLFGFALVYRNTLEQLRGGIYGTTDKQYFIYTDKGGFYGTMAELAGDLNYISDSNARPMSNAFYGLSLQAVSGAFSNELEVFYRNGYYGKKSSSTATFFEFSGVKAEYRGRLIAKSGADIHKAHIDLGYELLGNDENQFNYITPTGQNTRVEYTGKNHIMDSHNATASLGYVWYKDAGGFLPSFSAGAAVDGRARIRSTVLFPYYRNTTLFAASVRAFAQKNVIKGKSVFSFDASLNFRAGTGNPRDDGAYATSSTSLQSFDNYLDRQFEYDTAPAAGAGLGFTYTRRFTDKFAPYVKLTDDFSSLLAAPQYLGGRFRNVALITVGCSF